MRIFAKSPDCWCRKTPCDADRPRGCGKTSLAVETYRRLTESGLAGTEGNGTANDLAFDDLCLVELFPISDPILLAPAVLAALGVEGNKDQPAKRFSVLFTAAMLLVLDNCEHLVEHAARFVQTLLQGCPNLRDYHKSSGSVLLRKPSTQWHLCRPRSLTRCPTWWA